MDQDRHRLRLPISMQINPRPIVFQRQRKRGGSFVADGRILDNLQGFVITQDNIPHVADNITYRLIAYAIKDSPDICWLFLSCRWENGLVPICVIGSVRIQMHCI